MKIEKGVIILKNGKGWGVSYEDGHCTEHGWIDLDIAPIHDPKFCRKVTDVTYKNSHLIKELETGELVNVIRITKTYIIDMK